MFGRRPCAECGSLDCGDSPFVVLWVPAWVLALAVIVAATVADVVYTLATRH